MTIIYKTWAILNRLVQRRCSASLVIRKPPSIYSSLWVHLLLILWHQQHLFHAVQQLDLEKVFGKTESARKNMIKKSHNYLEYWYPVTFCEKHWCCLVCFISSSSTGHRLVLIWLRSIWGLMPFLTSHHEPPRIKHGTSNMKNMYFIPVVGLQERSPTMSTPFSKYKWVVFVVFNAELFSLEYWC